MTPKGARTRVLYLVYWGALEPLGQSLVVPAVLRLAEIGVDITLITFEKPADLGRLAEVERVREIFKGAGVLWKPLRYHRTPKWPATAFDSVAAIAAVLRLRFRQRFDIVHARTFVAGPMGYLMARILRTRFVYHNEGFYPDEQVDAGVWKKGSRVHRLAKQIEGFLYDHADGVIALSERSRALIADRKRVRQASMPVIVVPSAVDLEAFRPATIPRAQTECLSIVYLGSVGFRYRLDDAGRFVAALRKIAPGTSLTVVSRADHSLVKSMLDASGLAREAWSHKSLPHDEVPAELVRHDAGLLFWPQGLSEHGCSPTKVGEYWACGLPIVTTPNISDTDLIVRTERVGVIVDPLSPGSFEAGAGSLIELLSDPETSHRCRRAAERTYSLEAACDRQLRMYRELAQ